MSLTINKLRNGINIIKKNNSKWNDNKIIICFQIPVGFVFENLHQEYAGFSHFIEHLIFDQMGTYDFEKKFTIKRIRN